MRVQCRPGRPVGIWDSVTDDRPGVHDGGEFDGVDEQLVNERGRLDVDVDVDVLK
jgi:hypothetical protein